VIFVIHCGHLTILVPGDTWCRIISVARLRAPAADADMASDGCILIVFLELTFAGVRLVPPSVGCYVTHRLRHHHGDDGGRSDVAVFFSFWLPLSFRLESPCSGRC